MRFIDLFAGIGGFRRGMELAGHKCVGFCEYDSFATASYTSMHLITEEQREYLKTLDKKKRQKEIIKEEYRNGEWYAKDITEVRGGDMPEAECWCFGAPCQSFSVSGKREGLDGESGLVREVFRILREKREEDRPEWIIYENVKGMFSSNRGFDYFAILSEMDKLGYDVEWQLFNSKDWGVPQNRERVYTVGHLRRCGRRKIFPFTGADGANNIPVNQVGRRPSKSMDNPQTFRVYEADGISPCITAAGGGQKPNIVIPITENTESGIILPDSTGLIRTKGGLYLPGKVDVVCSRKPPESKSFGQRHDVWGAYGISGCLLASEYKDPHRIALPVKNGTKQGYALAHEGDSISLAFPGSRTRRGRVGVQEAHTLDTSCSQGIFVQVSDELTVYAVWYERYQCYIAIRKLTPKECFRLQGWRYGCGDDRYFERAEFVNSDSQLYKQAGNGVTVNVVAAIGERMMGGDNSDSNR